jgi:hypothetical protein
MFNYLVSRRQAGPNLNKSIWSSVPVPALTIDAIKGIAQLSLKLHSINSNSEEFSQERANLEALVFAEYFRGSAQLEGRQMIDIFSYITSEFGVLRSSEIRQFGEYRTQRLVLEAWDRLFGGCG